MPDPATRDATYEDLLQVEDHLVAELIHGQLVTTPRPAPRHARASSLLGVELGGPYDKGHGGPGGWWIFDEPEVHLGRHVLVPDLAGWRRERMPGLPETAWFELAPDWVCEVLSESTARVDRVEKLPVYAAHGVGHVWLVDPVLRTLEAYANHEGHWLLLNAFENDDPVSVAPFDAVTIPLGGLWAD
ncbi:Uma2 family endonuclease [Thioalkalivibrio sp. ALE11]|uniref:Uma2 family endonuclease n=1 Tax=Thioalkalivibrio sp. ALE11 TaxID=1265494 RepID=UPI00037BEE9C|nr:Uma2 family endonuclease [Thioalkalivibrio sp. ALE11]